MKKVPLNPLLLTRAREMRHDPAPAEEKLWRFLSDRQVGGFKFRRQHFVGPYVADFYCHELRLIVELDGDSHDRRDVYDSTRTKILDRGGERVIRFVNTDVFDHLDSVLEAIYDECERRRGGKAPSPQPSPEGRGGKTINFARYKFSPVIHLPERYEVFDLSNGFEGIKAPENGFGIGKYNEKRRGVYTTELFGGMRDIHVGIDIAGPVGTEVYAFFDGTVFLQGYNSAAGDYGYTIITRHVLDDAELFALHGHLSKSSLNLHREGDSIRAGELIAYLGDRDENGGWNPHLHFQLSYERPTKPDIPGVVSDADHERALQIYPDPRLVLGPLY